MTVIQYDFARAMRAWQRIPADRRAHVLETLCQEAYDFGKSADPSASTVVADLLAAYELLRTSPTIEAP